MEKKISTNGTFSKPTKHFTQVSNQILRDCKLSLRAKGLFALIASYITLPGFTLYKNYIQGQCSEGRCAFDSAWKELQQAGYLTHQRVRGEAGTFSYEYTLSLVEEDSSTKVIPDNKFYINATKLENQDTLITHHNVSVPEKPSAENQQPVLLYSNNKTLTKNTQSVHETRQMIERQIEFQYFKNDTSFLGAPLQAVDILVDFIAQEKEKVASEKAIFTTRQLESIDSCVICEFFEHMKERAPKKIRYPKAYWLSSFKNYILEKEFSILLR